MTDRIRWTQDGRALDLTLVGRLLPPESVAGDAHCRIGGQAHLYRVRTPTGEVRACKLAIDPENNSLLRREHDHYQRLHRDSARAAEWLLRCHGQGEHGGRAFLVLDWVEQSLRDRFPTASGAQNLASGPGPTLRERLRWAAAACDTIAAFHAAAGSTIIHQDIKPGNFLVAAEDPPRLLLSDLAGSRGLLRKTNGRSTTRPGAVTEGYAPPELELPQGVRRPTVQVDRFSLAVTVYELVTGQRPLKAGLSGAFSSEGRRLHDLHREVTLGEGLPGEEEEEYRVLSEKALPELLHLKGTLLGPRFGEHLARAFGEGAEAERRAKRLGDKLKEALAVSPEDRRVSPGSLADLCRDLADAVGDGPPKTVEPPRPRPLPKPNQGASVMAKGAPTAPPPVTAPPPPVTPLVTAPPRVSSAGVTPPPVWSAPKEARWSAPEESPAPSRSPADASPPPPPAPRRPLNDGGEVPPTQQGRSGGASASGIGGSALLGALAAFAVVAGVIVWASGASGPSGAEGDLTWVTVPASEGVIGDDGTSNVESDEKPRFRVRFTRSFRMLETEVTNRQYAAKNPGHTPVDDKPVVNVNWSDARAYCAAVGARLPTELEWEYAARAGGEGAYGLGAGGVEVTEANLQSYAWLTTNSIGTLHDVRQKKANAWGLYDLWGNVWEWVEDGYSDKAWNALSTSGTLLTNGARLVTDPDFVDTIGDSGANTPPAHRVLRGGSARYGPGGLRSGYRNWNVPTLTYEYLGFRCVLAPAPQPLNLVP